MTKNLHIEHPEDTILTGDTSFLVSLKLKGDLSVKIDGAPAIVWGTNPASGEFFVGTKSVFNKVKIKINESHQDIDANHTGEVATILHKCFDYLPRVGGIIQGDFIGFGGSDEYTPNTITYQFDDTVEEEIIVAPHTGLDQFEMPPVIDLIRQVYDKTTFVSDRDAAQIKQNVNKSIREGYPMTNEDFMGNESLMHLYGLMIVLKEELMNQCRNVGPEAYLGQDRIDGEGYVYSTELGTYKLVNRQQFSVANFNNTKFTTVS